MTTAAAKAKAVLFLNQLYGKLASIEAAKKVVCIFLTESLFFI